MLIFMLLHNVLNNRTSLSGILVKGGFVFFFSRYLTFNPFIASDLPHKSNLFSKLNQLIG